MVTIPRPFRCTDQNRLGSVVTKKPFYLSSLTEKALFPDFTKSDVDQQSFLILFLHHLDHTVSKVPRGGKGDRKGTPVLQGLVLGLVPRPLTFCLLELSLLAPA